METQNSCIFFFFANGGFPTLWVELIPPGPEKSWVKPMWPPGGNTGGLNLWFLKRGKPEIDIRTSSFERKRNCGPDHSANPLVLKKKKFM